mgnify:CR=1 FL=1|tara:strand:+ start:273 stop:422 length:150 start_codon:yes stop_codon:yes gene_type:complete
MWHKLQEHIDIMENRIERKKIMTPNPHYINMMINIGIFGMLVYVALQVS